jgi:hypothetical protein
MDVELDKDRDSERTAKNQAGDTEQEGMVWK